MAVTLRTRKLLRNDLLKRKQMVIDLYHPKAATVTRSDVTSLLASKFKVADDKTIFVFGFKTQFGGGKTTGFACIYDSLENALEIEPTYRLRRNNPDLSKKATTRKATRESKNKRKKLFATAKDKGKRKRKGADEE